ncbi:MAG TPA: hypothetical protein VF881_05665 [Polyangiaceae bacterium]
MRYSVLTIASVLVLLGAPAPLARAAPDDVGMDRCVGANTRAQSQRRDGKFGAARAELVVCGDASCPALVRDDCNQRLDELDRAQPTIVLGVRDNDGHDISEVTVEVDGRPFAQRLDGIAVAVDPGEHTFTFEVKGHPPKFSRRFVLREGEKGRRESILIGGTSPPVAAKGSSPGSSRAEATPLGAQRAASLVALGVGLVGIGAGVALAVNAKAKANDADAYCPGMVCANDAALEMNHDARVSGNLATVAFAVGAAGIAGAVVLWLTAKPSLSSPSAEVALVGGTIRVRGSW